MCAWGWKVWEENSFQSLMHVLLQAKHSSFILTQMSEIRQLSNVLPSVSFFSIDYKVS